MESDKNSFDVQNIDIDNTSYGSEDDFATDDDKRSSHDNEMDIEDNYYEVLTTEEIVGLQKQIIDEVNTIIQLPSHITRMLLNRFKWDCEKLLENFFDGDEEKFFKEAQVIKPFNKPYQSHENQMEECQICFTSLPSMSMHCLECGHLFCLTCWRDYLDNKICAEGLGHSIACAAHGCDNLVDDEFVSKVVTDQQVKMKYQKQITNSFVESNKLLRWCPSLDCTYAIKVTYSESHPVQCKCEQVFCFLCGQDWHDPVRCQWLKKWLNEVIYVNTKPCPNCHISIEKDGGCDHMVCANVNCNYSFCWICLRAWTTTPGSSNHKCVGKREVESQAGASIKNSKYYEEYLKHEQASKSANKLYVSVSGKMEDMQNLNLSWIEVQFMRDAVDTTFECHKTLMYSCIFAHYLTNCLGQNNQFLIFIDNLNHLKDATTSLSKYLETNITAANLVDIQQRVKDTYKYCEKRRKVLLDHVHEGYEKWWYDFKE